MPSLLLISDTENGKTSIRKRFEYLHPPKSSKEIGIYYPVVSIQMPDNPNAKSFLNSILEGMAQPAFNTAKDEMIKREVLNSIRELGVKLLIIDEIHHINSTSYKKPKAFLDLIKYISNEVSLPMVAIGTEASHNVFHSDSQLSNRFKKIQLPLWLPGDEFRQLLASYERAIPLKHPSKLVQQDLSLSIFNRTNGTIGEISGFLKAAAQTAILTGEEKITKELIQSVEFQSDKRVA
jgi:type II secretory pathway predicted ATPase ExeA